MNMLRKNIAEKLHSYPFLPIFLFLFFIFSSTSDGKGMPGSFSALVEKLSPSVVNITTSSKVPNRQELNPQLPPGSPFEDLFRDFMDREQNGSPRRQRRGTALGSGFIISKVPACFSIPSWCIPDSCAKAFLPTTALLNWTGNPETFETKRLA